MAYGGAYGLDLSFGGGIPADLDALFDQTKSLAATPRIITEPRPLISAALGELYRVMKPGGILVVTLDNPHSLSYLAGRLKRLLRPDPFYLGHTLSRRALGETLARKLESRYSREIETELGEP